MRGSTGTCTTGTVTTAIVRGDQMGAQSFTCPHAAHTSAAGMVMAFNPDDPHDGHATTDDGFSYRMIHIGPALVTDVLSDITGRPAGRPLFARPVLPEPGLARSLYRLHAALTGPASPLERGERLTAAVAAAARFAARLPAGPGRGRPARLYGRPDRPAGPGLPGRALRRPGHRGRAGGRRRAQPLCRLPGVPRRLGAGAQRVPAAAPAAGRPPGPGRGPAAGRGGRRRRVRRPGPPHPLGPPLLRDHPGRVPPRRRLTRRPSARSAQPERARWPLFDPGRVADVRIYGASSRALGVIRRGRRRPGQRSDWKDARISAENRSGCSHAAKWPPRSSWL